ncbi:hypothetical protein MPTK2_8g13230 [Marchantia polymorpha subsp. ruderalis]
MGRSVPKEPAVTVVDEVAFYPRDWEDQLLLFLTYLRFVLLALDIFLWYVHTNASKGSWPPQVIKLSRRFLALLFCLTIFDLGMFWLEIWRGYILFSLYMSTVSVTVFMGFLWFYIMKVTTP